MTDFQQFLPIFKVTDSYKNHSRVTLLNKFIIISKETIDTVLAENNFHFAPTYRQLEDAISSKEAQLRQRLQNHLDKFKTVNSEQLPSNVLNHYKRRIPPSKYLWLFFLFFVRILNFFVISS
jgi:hypothetical protein